MKQLRRMKGFTLVELLIVIALIAILSVAVLATINPIEQTNKARDSRVQNDAAEVMNAAERYYASVSKYPWEDFLDKKTSSDFTFLRSDQFGFGVCNGAEVLPKTLNSTDVVTKCDASDQFPNLLISTSELKESFAGKDEFPIANPMTHVEQAMWLVRLADANSFYVCYVPKANANRNDVSKMRCIDSTTGAVSKAVSGAGVDKCDTANVALWTTPVTDGKQAMFRCVPE